jgi:hypothetical protein
MTMRKGDAFRGRRGRGSQARRGDGRQRFVPREWMWSGRDLFHHGRLVGTIRNDGDAIYKFIACVGDRRSDPMSYPEAYRLVEEWAGRTGGSVAA